VSGKTPQEAADNFIYYLRETLTCLSSQFVSAYRQSDKLFKVYYEPYARVRVHGGDYYQVSITQIFRVIPDPREDKQFKARTQEYSYSLLGDDDGHELLSYHWHPNDPGVKYPHLHIAELKRIHFPTSRVCLEDFVSLLFRDYDVKPNLPHAEYKRILEKNKKSFEKWATWKIQHN
jgi:hypothetical protein